MARRHEGVVGGGELGQRFAQRATVVEVPVEVVSAEAVLGDDVLVAVLHELGQQRRAGDGGGVDVVLVQEARQRLVGVEDVAVLVLAEQRAGLQGVQHGQAFLGVEQPRTEHGDLTFEHLGQVGDVDAAVGLDRHEVVRVIKTVLTLVGVDAVLEVCQGDVHEGFQIRQSQIPLRPEKFSV